MWVFCPQNCQGRFAIASRFVKKKRRIHLTVRKFQVCSRNTHSQAAQPLGNWWRVFLFPPVFVLFPLSLLVDVSAIWRPTLGTETKERSPSARKKKTRVFLKNDSASYLLLVNTLMMVSSRRRRKNHYRVTISLPPATATINYGPNQH